MPFVLSRHERQYLLFFVFFSLIWCEHHSRTLLPTLDSREMFASATAALRTPPSLFLYVGARTDYTVKYMIKYIAAVSRKFAFRCRSSPVLLEASFVLPYRHIFRWQHCTSPKTYVRGADNTDVYEVISDYLEAGTWKGKI